MVGRTDSMIALSNCDLEKDHDAQSYCPQKWQYSVKVHVSISCGQETTLQHVGRFDAVRADYTSAAVGPGHTASG